MEIGKQATNNCPYQSLIFRLCWHVHRYLDSKRYFWAFKKYMRQIDSLNRHLSRCWRIDLLPEESGERGFKLVLNNREALKFKQDGDHFSYDGCDIGKFENGRVIIFDNLEK